MRLIKQYEPLKSRLALVIALSGWIMFTAWLAYDYAEYNDLWIIHIFRNLSSRFEINTFHFLIILVPFLYTFLGYLVNEREKLLNALRESESRYRTLSLQDELTGLLNRRGFGFLAEQQLKIADRKKRKTLLLYLDIDDMKGINDNFGHQAGDLALIATADILKVHIRRADILARISGDEFVALIDSMYDDFKEVLAARIEESVKEFNSAGKTRFRLSFSLGFAYYDSSAPCSIEELLARADGNMYAAKKGRPAGPV